MADLALESYQKKLTRTFQKLAILLLKRDETFAIEQTNLPASAMTLADFTRPGLIIPELRRTNVSEVIRELGEAMHRHSAIPDLVPFCEAVLHRESQVNTDMEPGMAFPHARLPGLKGLLFALGRSREPVAWSTRSGHGVRLVFLIAIPDTAATQYLSLISGLVRLSRDLSLKEKLLNATEIPQILSVLEQITLRTNPTGLIPKKEADRHR